MLCFLKSKQMVSFPTFPVTYIKFLICMCQYFLWSAYSISALFSGLNYVSMTLKKPTQQLLLRVLDSPRAHVFPFPDAPDKSISAMLGACAPLPPVPCIVPHFARCQNLPRSHCPSKFGIQNLSSVTQEKALQLPLKYSNVLKKFHSNLPCLFLILGNS